MPKKNYAQIAQDVLKKIGGPSNVKYLEHCSTRLRFNLHDTAKADVDGIKAIPGVIGVVVNAQFQVVIGQDVTEVYDEIVKLGVHAGGLVPDDPDENAAVPAGGTKVSLGAKILDFMIGIFNPLVPAITGAGLVKTIITLAVTAGWMSSDSGVYSVLYYAADAAFYFLPIMVAVTTASKIGCDRIIAVVIVGLSILPGFTALLGGEGGVSFLGITVPNYTYSSQIFPSILTVLFLALVEKNFRRICPKAVRIVFVPVVCLLVVAPVSMIVLAPLGFKMGEIFTNALLALHDTFGWVIVALLGAILPFLTAAGMHKPLVPYATAAFASTGYDYINAPAKVAHNISEAGACFAVALKTKKKEYRPAAFSAGISAFFGISEPALYGVTLQNKKAMVGVVVSGLLSAAFMSIFQLRSTSLMGTGILGLPQFIDPANPRNLLVAVIGYALSIVISFLVTFVLYQDEEKKTRNN